MLGEAVGAPQEFQPFLRRLTPAYTVARYPDVSDEIPARLFGEADVHQFMGRTEEVLAWVAKACGRRTPRTVPTGRPAPVAGRADAALRLPGEGEALKDSDYDVLIVSPDFAGIPFMARMSLALELWDAPFDLDVLCYNP